MGMCDCFVTIIVSPFHGPRRSNCRLTFMQKECGVLVILNGRTRRAILKHLPSFTFLLDTESLTLLKLNSVLTHFTLSCSRAEELNTGLYDQKGSSPPCVKCISVSHLFLFAYCQRIQTTACLTYK